MLIAQISDTHITAPGTLAYGIAPVAENLERCVEHINRFVPRPDLVLLSGDITQAGLPEEFEHAARLLDALQMPYYVIPGNHDDRLALWAAFGGRACPSRAQGFINYVVEGHDIRLIALDSTVPGASGGEICERRAGWLDARLSEDRLKPTLLFMHHPPLKFGVIETDVDGFEGADRLAEVIRKYDNITKIVCGHIHVPANTLWCGTVVCTAPSIAMQLVLDLNRQCNEFTLEAPAYLLHYWTADENMITFNLNVSSGGGPYPFEYQSNQSISL
jgi:Icc protein